MASLTLCLVSLAVLLCSGPTLGSRVSIAAGTSAMPSRAPSRRGDPASASAAAGGICQSRVEIYGYACEEHTVTTKDGYILGLQRIPNGRSASPPQASKTPVLLQHGLMMDGVTWLMNSPDESLGYILADNGYDVWIANSRGTVSSRGHTSLSPVNPAYWDWSWDELAAFDLPATVEYIYTKTAQQKIHYVGHSLGTLIPLASFSQGNLVSMVRSAALLSPIAYMGQMPSPLARLFADRFAAEALYWLGLHVFDSNSVAARNLLETFCSQPGVNCFDLTTILTGKNCCLNSSSIQVFLEHEQQLTSTMNMIHLSQMIRSGTITKYDYGAILNMAHYGQATPPAYTMSSIPGDLPLFIGYGGRDALSGVRDVEHLLDSLKSHDADKLTAHFVESYAHLDFPMAYNAKQVVYDSVMEFFKNH